jgi:predicted lipoprotein with Yx(FWY)xxD motif
MPRIRYLIAVAACAAIPAGCGDDSELERDSAQSGDTTQGTTAPETAPQATAPEGPGQPRGPLVKLGDSQFGPVIFNERDQAAYFFTLDGTGKSRCYDGCAIAWPPFYANGKPRAGPGIKRALLGTVQREGGRRQVTYAGKPLYFYAHDPKGEVLCNDIAEFGGTWFAVTAEGKQPA